MILLWFHLALASIEISDVWFAPGYEPERLKDEFGEDFQGCLLPDSSIEFMLNRYAVSLHKTLKLHKFELLRRTPLLEFNYEGGRKALDHSMSRSSDGYVVMTMSDAPGIS